MNQTPNTSPLHQFRDAVAQRLHTAPFNWGSCGFNLQRRYNDLVQEYWNDGETVDDTAAAVHKLQMSRSQRVYEPTRASLQRAGCQFDDLEIAATEFDREDWDRLADEH